MHDDSMHPAIVSRADVAERLALVRPDRYVAGSSRDWAAEVVAEVARDIDQFEARRMAAEQIVAQVEGAATRAANLLMRQIHNTGALPLDWWDRARWPLSVGDDRVCFEALTPEDVNSFAIEEERATADYSARLDAVEGARLLSELLRKSGAHTVRDLARAGS